MKIILALLVFQVAATVHASAPLPPLPLIEDLATLVDVNINEPVEITLGDGSTVRATVLRVDEERDAIRRVLRRADVHLEINGAAVVLTAGLYNLPMTVAGVQVDAPVTKGYLLRSGSDYWKLEKDVRLRFWPGDSPLTAPNTFCYPIRQKWFASDTWYDNEPVDGGAEIVETVYYHAGVDLGAMEGVTEALAVADALVVSSRGETLPDYVADTPVRPREDVVYLQDGRGWFYRYSHFHAIAESVRPGVVVSKGSVLGTAGKEGASGGWSHLHFDIECMQPSGRWGIIAAHALLREAYIRERQPQLIANARQRHLLRPGEKATLDGTKSWSATDAIVSYEWRFTDDDTAEGAVVERMYALPGRYNEILKVTDADGRVDYDFAIVQVINPKTPNRYSPSLHAVYEPTFDIRPGDPVIFGVRAFRFEDGEERWDFGDGSTIRYTRSSPNPHPHAQDGYARIEHRFDAPGDYIVRVHRVSDTGIPAYTHLHVVVEARPEP